MKEVVIVGVGGLEYQIQQDNIDEPMGGIAFKPPLFDTVYMVLYMVLYSIPCRQWHGTIC